MHIPSHVDMNVSEKAKIWKESKMRFSGCQRCALQREALPARTLIRVVFSIPTSSLLASLALI